MLEEKLSQVWYTARQESPVYKQVHKNKWEFIIYSDIYEQLSFS